MPEVIYKGLEKCLKPQTKTCITSIKIDDKYLIRPVINDHVEKLKKNIEFCGQMNPVFIEEYKQGLFHVVAHAHEFSALQKIAEEVIKENPATVFKIDTRRFEGTDAQRKIIQLSENVTHEPMTKMQIGKQVFEIIELDPDMTQKAIGGQIGWSGGYISQCLSEYRESLPSKHPKAKQKETKTDTGGANNGNPDPVDPPPFQEDDDDPNVPPTDPPRPPASQNPPSDPPNPPTDPEPPIDPPKPIKNGVLKKDMEKKLERTIMTNNNFKQTLRTMTFEARMLNELDFDMSKTQAESHLERLREIQKVLKHLESILKEVS